MRIENRETRKMIRTAEFVVPRSIPTTFSARTKVAVLERATRAVVHLSTNRDRRKNESDPSRLLFDAGDLCVRKKVDDGMADIIVTRCSRFY